MGMADYLPAGCFRESAIKSILEAADVCFAKTSAPDANGYLSFSPARWTNRAELRADAAARYHV